MEKIKILLWRWWMPLMLLILAPFLWLIAQVITQSTNIPNSNFFKMWLANHLVWVGGDPYSATDWVNGHLAFHSTWVPEKAYLYPLPLAYILAPLGLLDPLQSYRLWVFMSLFAAVIATFMLVNAWERTKSKLFALLLITFFFFFAPLIQTVGKGTVGGVLLLAAVCACELFRRKQSFWGGAVFTLLLLKPQLGVPILAIMGLWMLFCRDWRGLTGMAAGGLLLFVIGEVADLGWVGRFLAVSQQKFGLTFGFQPTIFSMSSLLCGGVQGCTMLLGGLITLVLTGLLAILVFRKAKTLSATQVFGLAVPLGMLVTPYLWSYDHILLVVSLVCLSEQLLIRTKKFIFAVLMLIIVDILAGFTFSLQRSTTQPMDFWSITVPFIILLVSILFVLLPPPRPDEQVSVSTAA